MCIVQTDLLGSSVHSLVAPAKQESYSGSLVWLQCVNVKCSGIDI